MEFKDYYQTLGVARAATQDEIKRAYRKLARKYHPDVSKVADAEARFKEVQEAYEVLKDPEKRAAYDDIGRHRRAGEEFHPPPDWDGGFAFRGGEFTGADSGRFSDFFSSLFGGGGFGPQPPPREWHFKAPGSDQEATIVVSLKDAWHGAVRSLSLTVPEIDDQGRVVNRARTLNVKIPKGVMAGQRIRLAGQGSPGSGGGPAGDLYLKVEFEPHPHFSAEQRDIHLELPVTPWEAALGATVTVPTLGGKVDLRIPPGSQSGKRLRLRGQGLPGHPPGDQYVILRIMTPPAATAEDRALYQKMAETMPMNPRAEWVG